MSAPSLIARALNRYESGKLSSAESLAQRALGAPPQRADALHLLGLISHARGAHQRALELLEQALAAAPHNHSRRIALGLLAFEVRDFKRCTTHLQPVLGNLHQHPEALSCLARAHTQLGDYETACGLHERLLSQHPQHPRLWRELAATYMAWGQADKAVTAYRRANQLAPSDPATYYDLGTALLQARQITEAIATLRQAVAKTPDDVRSHLNLGIALKKDGQLAASLQALHQAYGLAPADPEVQWNLALTLLLQGNFEQGFAHFEARFQLPGHPLSQVRRWQGEPLDGQPLLVMAEQGLGDTFQFLHFVDDLVELSSDLVLQCRSELVELLRTAYRGPVRIEPLTPGRTEQTEPHDRLVAPLLSLPHLLGRQQELQAKGPYLFADQARATAFKTQLADAQLSVGLAWQGNPSYREDHLRSFPLTTLSPLFDLPQVEFVSLQRGFGEEQLTARPDLPVRDLGHDLRSPHAFIETASLITALDLVITSDTAVAHLAGALGAEVWLLLCYLPDYRWGIEGNRWYPTMRIFRQTRRDDWATVVTQVRQALQERCTAR